MVTRILLDPRRDLPDGSTLASTTVLVEATPTGIREDGSVVVLPTTLPFTITTAADLLQLPATTASWKWRLVVRDPDTRTVLQQRTVLVPDQTSIAYADLPDVDPASLGNTPSSARNWDAVFAQLLDVIAQLTNQSLDDVNRWSENTTYQAGTVVLNPDEQFVQANVTHTSGSSYDPSKWTIQTLNLAGVQALIAQQAAQDANTYLPLPTGTKTAGYAPIAQTDGTVAWTAVSASGGTGSVTQGLDGNYYLDSTSSSSVAQGSDGNYYLAA